MVFSKRVCTRARSLRRCNYVCMCVWLMQAYKCSISGTRMAGIAPLRFVGRALSCRRMPSACAATTPLNMNRRIHHNDGRLIAGACKDISPLSPTSCYRLWSGCSEGSIWMDTMRRSITSTSATFLKAANRSSSSPSQSVITEGAGENVEAVIDEVKNPIALIETDIAKVQTNIDKVEKAIEDTMDKAMATNINEKQRSFLLERERALRKEKESLRRKEEILLMDKITKEKNKEQLPMEQTRQYPGNKKRT